MDRMRTAWIVLLTLLLGPVGAAADGDTGELGYYRQPAIHGDTIVFVAEGDLYAVPTTGGRAKRLTTHPAREADPAISPDGRWIAFTARYEGPREVYVMPIDGGRPQRLTYGAGSPRVVGWQGGMVLYSSRRYSGLPNRQLIGADVASGNEWRFALDQADEGALSDDRETLYFTRLPFQGSHCKRYQGGSVQQLWRFATKGGEEAEPLTADHPGTSKNPMLHAGRLYHLTDRDGTMNVWSLACEGERDLKQHTKHPFFDIKEASLHAGRIAYRLGADIHVLDLATGSDTKVDIRLVTDADQTRRKWITSPMSFLTSAHLSPDGDRVVLTSRGRAFIAPVGKGRFIALPPQGTARNRAARFSHDGKAIQYFSDHTDEVELWSRPANGSGTPTQLTNGGSSLRVQHRTSPDGRFVAHTDLAQGLYLKNTKAGTATAIEEPGNHLVVIEAWSRDSQWLVYRMEPARDFNQAILRLVNVNDGKKVDITTTHYNSHSAAFGPEGKWLYFLSERSFDSIARSPWGPRQPEPHYDQQTRIYALALKPGLRPPFQEPDEVWRAAEKARKKVEADKKKAEAEKKKKAEAKGDDAKKKDAKQKDSEKKDEKKPKPIEIEREGIASRLYVLPVKAGRYDSLVATKRYLLWRASPAPFVKGKSGGRRFDLQCLNITDEKPEVKTRLGDVRSLELSQDGKKLLVRKRNDFAVVTADTSSTIDSKAMSKGGVSLSDWRFAIDPKVEWAQMYDDAWRMHRDYFYDPGMHGVNWKRMREVYRPLVARVRDRDELQDLTGMLVSELSALHASVRGGDVRTGPLRVDVASLGGVFLRMPEKGGYRLEHVHVHDPDRPELRSPLARPDIDVKRGDILVAVDHQPAMPSRELGQLLVDKAGKQVHLTFRREGRKTDAEVILKPITQQQAWDRRYHEWEYTRRTRVEKAAEGRIGYVHLRGMGANDMAAFVRQFYAVYQREGLILDVRHNWGGNIDGWVLSRLMRRAWMFWKGRTGEPYSNLRFAPRGHMIVLCNEETASDGEAFSEGFRRLGLGPVMGTRTWGGEIWLHSGNRLADRGVASAGMFGVFGPTEDGKGMQWLVEGHGVDPDFVLDNGPHETFMGKDAQLDGAITYLLDRLTKDPRPAPKVPPYPDKSFPNNR